MFIQKLHQLIITYDINYDNAKHNSCVICRHFDVDVNGVNGVAFGEDKLKFFVDTDEFIQQVLKTTAARPKK